MAAFPGLGRLLRSPWSVVAAALAAALVAALAAVLLAAPPSPGGGAPADFGAPPADTSALPTPAGPGGGDDSAEGAAGEDRPAAPVRVEAPRTEMTADVVPVGVGGDGKVAVPADPARAGWYRFGPEPGADFGSAVLVGHVDDSTGALGALAALHEVRPGDELRVTVQGRDEPLVYRVSARSTVPQTDLPDAVFRRDGPHVLTLVTCAPPYDGPRDGYRNNLVVTAVPG